MTVAPTLRPPFAYYGGKTRLAPRIAAMLPPHRIYTEAFAGSLAVLLAKPPSTHEVINDLDGLVVNFWRQLRERPDDLARLCAATPYSRDEYADAADLDIDDDMERARRWWVRITQSHSRICGTTGWSTGFARSGSRASETMRSAARMPAVAERLRRVSIENRDALEVIDAYDQVDAVHYVDPPYLSSSRNSRGYRYEMGGAADHEALAEVLRSCVGTVVLSGYDDPLYDRLYGDWWRLNIPAVKSNGGIAGGDQSSVEVVWSNRDLTTQPSLLPAGDDRDSKPTNMRSNNG